MNFKTLQILLIFLFVNSVVAQEWKSLKVYKKETGKCILEDGCWLKKDRKQKSNVWKQANFFNLSLKKGNLKYTTISQIRDFYKWADEERIKQGHKITGVGIGSIAATQLSYLDNGFIRFFIVRNKEIVVFANDGSQKVFEFAFSLLNELLFSNVIYTNEKAKRWDIENGLFEQCEVLEPLYQKLSTKALNRLERMAKGKGIFKFAIPNELKFEGEISNCQTRFEHGKNKIKPYYLKNRDE